MSRASWVPFEEHVYRLLLTRHVPKADAKTIASEVVDACGHYLNRLKDEVVGVTLSDVGRSLNRTASLADELRTLLEGTSSIFSQHWTPEDRTALIAALTKLSVAAQTLGPTFRPKPGIKPDFRRHSLEENIGWVLMRHGVAPTKAKAGTFALVLEQVHHAVGIPERDVHKSVRRAHSALKRAQKAG